MNKQYANRDVVRLDEDGGHYSRHVRAMAYEGLDSKPAIAAELASRDWLIAALQKECAASRLLIKQIQAVMACNDPGNYEMIFGEPPQ